MADRPIIFSAPMVRALLQGRKTMTRRLAWKYTTNDPTTGEVYGLTPSPWQRVQPGDRLWVRENCWTESRMDEGDGVRYPADSEWRLIQNTPEASDAWFAMDRYAHNRHPCNDTNCGQQVPSIHMPRWASRLTLTVTEARMERLHAISEADAMAEGAAPILVAPDGGSAPHVEGFHDLWNSLHGAEAWDANPEVVALTFTVTQRNIDADA